MRPTRTFLVVSLLSCLTASAAHAARKRGGPTIPKVEKRDQICFALYTVSEGVLKMTAQLYPLSADDSRAVRLEVAEAEGEGWKTVARATVREDEYGSPPGAKLWTAHFRVTGWDASRDHAYRVVALDGVATYEGRIRRDPVEKDRIVVAAFTGNSNRDRRLKPDIVENIKAIDPDLLFFSGDQSYDHRQHLGAWLLFGRQFGEIIKDRPTICIPDDHDIGQANIWGAGGKKSNTGAGHDGGYYMPVAYVNAVQRAQTWHMPDPYDPTPIQRGITVFYTAFRIGRVGFAVMEDRKFKSGPQGLVPKQGPRPDHIRNPKYDPKSVDVEGAVLLGERQLEFLRSWGQDWTGHDMKCVLSQTVLANAAHLHGGIKNRLHADMDSNGWPQTGRDKALDAIRRSFAFMLCGDQHLATVIHHGIDDWDDAGWSFCVPSIVNYYNRWWWPLEEPVRRVKTTQQYAGAYRDGFANLITVHAYANPDQARPRIGEWGARAAGFGLVTFDLTLRKIEMECWRRGTDVTKPDLKQFEGWPIVVDQLDNYGRKAAAYLPEIHVRGARDQVVQVVREDGDEAVYTVRMKGATFRPKVFAPGRYTVHVGEGDARKTFTGVESHETGDVKPLVVDMTVR